MSAWFLRGRKRAWLLMGEDRELQENLANDDGCSSGSPLTDAVAFLSKMNSSVLGIMCFLNRDNPVPNCPNSYSSIARKETQHTMCRWYRQFISLGYRLSGRTGSALVWHFEGRTFATHSVHQVLWFAAQPALQCAIRGAEGVLPCVGCGVRLVNWIYRLWRHCSSLVVVDCN